EKARGPKARTGTDARSHPRSPPGPGNVRPSLENPCVVNSHMAHFGVIDRSIGEPPCARRCRRTEARNTEALLAAAVVLQEGVADEADDRGEGEDLGVTPASARGSQAKV